MRHCGGRRRSFAVALIGAAAVTLASAAGASAENSHGPKVDDLVALAADSSTPDARIPVIVFGRPKKGSVSVKYTLSTLGAQAGTIAAKDLDRVAGQADVTYIAADRPVDPTGDAPISFPNLSTQHPEIDGAPVAWSRGLGGERVGIAIVDSGVVTDNDFGPRLGAKIGYENGDDKFGHGSFVAALAAGTSRNGNFVGIAPEADVYAANVAGPSGTYTSDVLNALEWVSSHANRYNIRVVNLSVSENSPSSYQASALDGMVERLWRQGIVVVTAVGNRGAGYANYAPGNDPFAISVGALNTKGTLDTADDRPASWSSSGDNGDGIVKPDILAPAVRVPSLLQDYTTLGGVAPADNWTGNDYATMSGTSFAAPQVAGAAAILFEQHPEWTPDQVKGVLLATARPVQDSTAGALDIAAAVSFVGMPPVANAGLAWSPYAVSDSAQYKNSNTWNSNSWSANGWTANGWTANGWTANGWTANGWTGISWASDNAIWFRLDD